jgi:hypothetical protein
MRKIKSTRRKPIRRKPVRARANRAGPATPEGDQVYRLASTKQALAALPDDVRCMVLLGGHIVNELTTLTRLLVFSSRVWPDKTEGAYAGIQYLTLIRLMIGKVAEGLEVFHKRVLSRPFGRTYLPEVQRSQQGRQAVAQLTQMVGSSGLLQRLRNSHTFHNPSDAHLVSAFNALNEDEDWSMMGASARHTLAFPMSQAVLTRALMDETGIADPRAATEKMRDEVLDAADGLITFFEHLAIAVAEKHNLFIGRAEAIKDTSQLPSAFEVKIPPLCSGRRRA